VDFDYPKDASTAPTDTDDTFVGQVASEWSASRPADQSGFFLLTDGIDALGTRLQLALKAERTIDAQYYLITNDMVGLVFVRSLLKAADRGVRVRLLLDDIQTQGYDAGMAALDSHPNFEIRIFNPFASRTARFWDGMWSFSRINRRMHNKSFTADNRVTIIGGRNIADEYFAAREDVNMGDIDVLGVGPVVQDISDGFDTYWNHPAAVPVPAFAKMPEDPAAELAALRERLEDNFRAAERSRYGEAVKASIGRQRALLDHEMAWAPYQVVYDSPDKSDKKKAKEAASIVTPLKAVAQSAEREAIFISPYFVPKDEGIAFLTGKSAQGVDVKVITNSLMATNHDIVHTGYMPARKPLLKGGVRLFEVRPDAIVEGVDYQVAETAEATLHTKGFIIDREHLFLGSFNWDPRSVDINTELGVVIDSPLLASRVAEFVTAKLPEATWEAVLSEDGSLEWIDRRGGQETILTKEPGAGFWKRTKVGFMRILPVKSQL
jgi:putative cardiolipin synthase